MAWGGLRRDERAFAEAAGLCGRDETGIFDATLHPLARVAIPNDTATETVGAALHYFRDWRHSNRPTPRRCIPNRTGVTDYSEHALVDARCGSFRMTKA